MTSALVQVGRALAERLRALDMAAPDDARFWWPNVAVNGETLAVRCTQFGPRDVLTVDEARTYLAWLDAGHDGTPSEWRAEVAR